MSGAALLARLGALLRDARVAVQIMVWGAWLVALVLAFVLHAAIGLPTTLLLFVPSVAAAAFLAGVRLGLAATALSLAGGAAAAKVGGEGAGDANFIVFALVGLALSLGGAWALREHRARQHALKSLEGREAHLRSIMDSSPDAMIVIDERGAIQSFGASAERMFGWTPAEALGRNVSILMSEADRAKHDGFIARYLATGEKRIIGIGRDVVGMRKSGEVFPMELAVGETSNERGRFFTGVARDLSERRRTEARLQEMQAELAHVARSSAMGEMASALAHEINQPLSAAANYLSAARRLIAHAPDLDQRALEALDKAAEQSVRAGEIIRRLREFLERGDSERGVESLSAVVKEAGALAMIGAAAEGVRIDCRFDPGVDRVLIDRVQIQQVVVNLVRNAIDAMAEAPRRELVVTSARDGEGFAEVSVADTGAGLAPSIAERLFQPFVTTKQHGMGVGLSLSRSIIEDHGGRIWAEPNPGGGAVFRFTVPLAPSGAPAQDGAA